ncbi:nuclear transport factor 2 family protein [Pseudoflavitalea sp. G-6-1-2]|uniref:nuclear transport factor 2 family protein n=1 Tax=Pseudoflavitalea sp. G-6-1-2 TaxID=2728841 RepID=UPI00146C490D|nr:nuclear transport factor 2 family protein [Pseudoflavitalea sp. G-6-1-2]NML20864.1 nuclear transport factor 2 family protein [Pseudoflavitalea sp. G-6-1-2]
MKKILLHSFIACFLFVSSSSLTAQENDQQLTDTILRLDRLFWDSYNNCDLEKFAGFFTDDVEFYHDKGGVTIGVKDLTASMRNGLCADRDNFKLRREAVSGSVKVFPLRKNNVIYGAIISGEHIFNVQEKGKKESAEGLANFTHLWLLKDGVWKMARVLSFDHRAVPYTNKRTAINMSESILRKYAGSYKGPQSGIIAVKTVKGGLSLTIGNKTFEVYPEKENLFFLKERDLTFGFHVQGNKAVKMIVSERGVQVETLEAEKSESKKTSAGEHQ